MISDERQLEPIKLTVTVTVAGEAENPYVGLTVYAFDGSTYSGYSAVTDAGGKVVFTLPLGEYRFRADFDGVEFWSGNENTCTLPTCTADKVTLPGGTGMQEVSIDYTYDALNRLTSATYSNGTKFAYTYDAAGNVLTYAATHYGLTTTTTYTYDEANQLLSAVDSSTAWTYTYDGNGSLLQSDPGTGSANGSTRYTYNTAGYLTKLETYTTDWQTQSEMTYDGLGNRLETTTYTDGVGNTTRYVLDSGATLTAIGAESSTFYLYGRGVIGTLGESWSYILQDGAGSTRQLVDTEGAVQLSISYTPWGDTLEVYGSGMLNLGYMGGVYDAGTGLIYMGNGQYYDPSTGRFLTRGMKGESTNPYTPWSSDPAGMLIGPFGFLALLFAKKKKHTKLDAIIVVVILLALMGFGSSIAMPVQAAGITDAVSMPVAPRSYAVQAESATVGARMPANPGAPVQKLSTENICGIENEQTFLEKLLDLYLIGWENFFTAFEILVNPYSNFFQKEWALIYMFDWGIVHYAFAAGFAVLIYVFIVVVILGEEYCVVNGTCVNNQYNAISNATNDVTNYLNNTDRKIIDSLQKNVVEHEKKLLEYINNPDAFDNKGFLQNAPNEIIRQQIINGRINHLQTEINAWKETIGRILGK